MADLTSIDSLLEFGLQIQTTFENNQQVVSSFESNIVFEDIGTTILYRNVVRNLAYKVLLFEK